MASSFLFYLLCAIVSCDQYYPPPTPRPNQLSGNGNTPPIIHRRGRLAYQRPVPIVETDGGTLEGYFMKVVSGREIYAFEGIPYAESPSGSRRFRAPVPKRPWKGIREAKDPGPICLQIHLIKLNRVTGREDCLTVNVYTPMISTQSHNPNLSVMIWLHGGGFSWGAGSEYGPACLLQKDMILVTVNFRQGILGFLSTGDDENPGNWALKDQALAIQWVVDNIAAFGGNNRNITLAGQSSGGVAVHLHMMSSMSKHKFQRGISMSGSALVPWAVHTPHQARKWAEKLAKFVNCPINLGSATLMRCFRTLDPNRLVGNLYNIYDIIVMPPVLMRPVIEPDIPGAFLTLSPEESYERNQVARIPLIASNTDAEAALFSVVLIGTGLLRLWLKHWRVLAPTVLDYGRITPGNSTAVTNALANFYFPGRDISKLSGNEFAQVGSDRYCFTGNRKTLQYHSQIAPTYSYILSQRNPYGTAYYFGMDPKEYGVSHTEDIPFLFNSSLYWEAWNGREESYSTAELMQNMFFNFATKGEPLETDKNGEDHRIWKPIRQPNNPIFLRLGEKVKMIRDPRRKQMRFWESLGLNESFPYQYA